MNHLPSSSSRKLESSKQLARVLDTFVRIPGTRMKIGIDPILGLIPGIGDALAAGLGGIILIQAMESGAPRLLVFRMAGNLMTNATLGAIPLVGDLFSVWFHSNSRNYTLLKSWQETGKPGRAPLKKGWIVVGCLLFLLVIVGLGWLAFWGLGALWHWFRSGTGI